MTYLLIIALVLFSCLLLLAGFWTISSFIGVIIAWGVPYVPLSKYQLSLLKKNVKVSKDDKVVDLGCGDGRVLFTFEEMGVENLVGYEVNAWAYVISVLKKKIRRSKAKLYLKNFNPIDLSEYNIVFCYLLPYYLDKIEGKLKKELKPGAKVISFGFEFKNWKPVEIICTDQKNKRLNRIFVYKID